MLGLSGSWSLLRGTSRALTFAQSGLDLRVVEVGHRAQSEGDGIGELREAYDHDGLENLLFGKPVGSQCLDVTRRGLGRLLVELGAKVQKRFVGHRDLGMDMINRNLLRLRPFDLEHTNHFAVRGHAIGAQVRRRRDQEDVFFLPAREAAVLEQNGAHERNFGFDQVRARCLGDVEIGQKPNLFPHCRERREIFFVEREISQVSHVSPQAKQLGGL
jgi:hypothetical protein